MQLDHRRRRCAADASTAAASGSMNSETRMPASLQRVDDAAQTRLAAGTRRARPRSCAPRAARARGSRRAAVAQRDGQHLVGRRHLEVERHGRARALSRAMSSSEMCRRSSRRCAVMPSAPASTASVRGAHRIGMRARRAHSGWWRRGRCSRRGEDRQAYAFDGPGEAGGLLFGRGRRPVHNT